MSDITPDDPDIPPASPGGSSPASPRPPGPDDSTPEVEDQPLGPPADMPAEDAPLPGIPENEPPASE